MDKDTRIRLSNHLVLECADESSGERTIFNNLTGLRVRVSAETIKLLASLRTPTTCSQLADTLNLGTETERETLTAHLKMLWEHTVLVEDVDEAEERNAWHQLAAESMVSTEQQTLAGAPSVRLEEVNSGAFVICGANIDFGTTGKSGAKDGPRQLRAISRNFLTYDRDIFTGTNQGWYNADLKRTILKAAVIQDAGNVAHVLGEAPQQYYERLKAVASIIARAGATPIFLGGDHSLSGPVIEGCAEVHQDSLVVVQFDAHTDLAEWQPNKAHHHGNVMRRILHQCQKVELVQVGIRGFAGNTENNPRHTTVTQAEVEDDLQAVLSKLPTGAACYISIDTDVLDPSFAPGVGTPVPMGMHPRQMLRILEHLLKLNSLIGLDIVELCPSEDVRDATGSLMFHLLMCALGYAHEGR